MEDRWNIPRKTILLLGVLQLLRHRGSPSSDTSVKVGYSRLFSSWLSTEVLTWRFVREYVSDSVVFVASRLTLFPGRSKSPLPRRVLLSAPPPLISPTYPVQSDMFYALALVLFCNLDLSITHWGPGFGDMSHSKHCVYCDCTISMRTSVKRFSEKRDGDSHSYTANSTDDRSQSWKGHSLVDGGALWTMKNGYKEDYGRHEPVSYPTICSLEWSVEGKWNVPSTTILVVGVL
jgi:hypothetical protein